MKRLILDSNIFFAALRSKNSKTRQVLLTSTYEFFAPNFLFVEIFTHKERILKKSTATEEEIYDFLTSLLNIVNFVSEQQITTENIIHAFRLCKDIDEKDTIFIALSLELGYQIWTRDEVLKAGLRQRGFDSFFDEQRFDLE